MRKLLTILTIINLFIGSCKKAEVQDTIKPKTQKINETKLVALEKMDIEERKLAYRFLNDAEKTMYWKSVITNVIGQNNSISDQAFKIVQELQNQIRPEIFRSNSNENVLFKDHFVPNWLEKAEKVLPSGYITEMAYKPSLKPQAKDDNLKSSPDVSTACACNIGSRFDCVKSKVHIGTDGISYTESHGACVGGSGGCESSTLGCGFIWLYSCNGSNCVF